VFTRDSNLFRASYVQMATWLLKSEPDAFSYDDLVRSKREPWDGIRNYTARIFLREMQVGDQAIFYHSNAKPPGAAGVCKVVKTAEPDPTQFDPLSRYYDAGANPADPRWDLVTIAPVRKFGRFVALEELRAMPELAESRLLARGNRLSVLPLTNEEFQAIVDRGHEARS
jgi:predicted RNA-binding protein with PUA-like domain